MIDFHSHILPDMDDGARDIKQSCRMLERMISQGVDAVVATPHYYRKENTPQEFINRRKAAFDTLCAKMPGKMPHILLGAEVAYFPGIGACEDLEMLCIEGTRTLLLEMPFCPWNQAILNDISALTEKYTVVLAHIERYWFMQRKKVCRQILHSSCCLQINAIGLCIWPLSAVERSCLRRGTVQVIGSDCHGPFFRPPCMGYAWNRIKKYLGEGKVQELDAGMRELITQ